MMRQKKRVIHKEGTGLLFGMLVIFFIANAYLYFAFEQKIAFYITLPVTLILTGLAFNFFRSPIRKYPYDHTDLVLASSDGVIVVIEKVYEPEVLKCECLQVSTFMTIFNVHAQWVPVTGKVTYLRHHLGRYMSAYLPKSSVENERSSILFETATGHKVLMRQVAGAVARRVVTYLEEGCDYETGDQLGFIKFGSRIDFYLPLDSEILVNLDDQVKGNLSAIARLPKR